MSIRAKTKKRLMILSGAALATLVIVGGLALYQLDQRAKRMAEYREQGLEAAERGDYAEALEPLNTYWTRHRDDVEAAYNLAYARQQVEEPQNRHLSEAIGIYRHLLDHDPRHEPAQRALLELYASSSVQMYVEAIELADRMLAQLGEDDVEVLRHKMISLGRLNRLQEALEVAERAIELDPTHLTTREHTLEIMHLLDRPGTELIEWAQAFHENYPEDPRAEILLARAYHMARDRENAVSWLRQAADHELEDPAIIQRLVTLMTGLSEFGEARRLLERSLQRVEDDDLKRMLVRWHWESNRYGDVLALLDDLDASSREADSELIALKAAASLREGEQESARQLIDHLKEREGDNTAAAWVPVLEQVLGADEQAGQEVTLSTTEEAQRVIEVCRESIQTQPNIPYVRAYLAEAQAMLGETELAIEEWRAATHLSQTWARPHLRLAETLDATGRNREAYGHALAALRRAPDSVAARLIQAQVAASLVETEQVSEQEVRNLLADLEQIQANLPGDRRMLPTYVGVLLQRGDRQTAVEAIEKALDSDEPVREQELLRLAEISRQHELGLTARLLDASEAMHGLSPNLAYARALTAHQAGETEAARAQLEQQASEAGGDDLAWQQAYARFLDVIGHENAAARWRQLVEANPENISLQRTVLTVRAVQDDAAFLDKVIDRIREISGERGLTWRLARARWLLNNSEGTPEQLAQARDMLQEVIRSSPSLVEPRLLLADTLKQLGERNAAIEQLTLILDPDMDPNNVEVLLELARLRIEGGEHENARLLVDRVLDSSHASRRQRASAADLLVQLGERERALAMLRQEGTIEGTSTALLLAELHLRRGEAEQAEEVYTNLMEQRPSASVIQAYSNFLGAAGRQAEAGEVLRTGREIGLEESVVAMLHAEYTRRYGSASRTVQYYREAIEADERNESVWRRLVDFHLDRGELDEAIAVSEEAADVLPNATVFRLFTDNADLIRLASGSERVRPLIRSMLHDDEHREAALQTLRVLNDAHQEERSFAEAAADVRRLANANPRFLQLQVLTADLYLNARDYEEGAFVALRAMQNFPNQPEPAQRAAQLLAADENWDRALDVARQWRQRELYNPVRADIAIAEAQLNLENPRAAVQQMSPYMERAMETPDGAFPIISVTARALVTMGQADQAAEMLEPLLRRGSHWRNLWVNVASQVMEDGRLAADWLNRVEAVIPEDAMREHAALATHWYRLGTRDDVAEYRERGLGILQTIASRSDAPPLAIATHGMIAHQEGDLATAESEYRRVLNVAPDHPESLNNLAMLLVEREGGDLDEALTLAERATRNEPTNASYHDTLGLVRLERREYAEAIAALQEAVRLDPNGVDWRVHLAAAHHRHGDADAALTELQELETRNPALDIDNLAPSVRARLEQLREELSEAQAALR